MQIKQAEKQRVLRKKKNLAFVVRPQNSKNSSRLQGKRPGQGRQGQNQGRPNGDGKRPAGRTEPFEW